MAETVDAIVIGLGPGGEFVAGSLAEAGWRVVGIEERLVGGECPYFGCIPSKMIVRAADLLAEGGRVPGMAGSATVSPDFQPVAHRIRAEATDDWDDTTAADRFTGKGGLLVRGHGRLSGPGRVAVGDREYEATRAIVLNPGTSPAMPPISGLGDVSYWTNREALKAERLPRTLTVLGGGAIGLEFAQAFGRFGVHVTIVEAADRLLAMEEPEASAALAEVLQREGVQVRLGATATAARSDGTSTSLELADGSTVTSERLLVAVGRRPNLGDLGLETVGLDPSARSIEVDDHLRAAERLWAIGDVTGHGQFTHVSMYQGGIALRTILGEPTEAAAYRALPRVTFTDPEVGAAGLTEEQARGQGIRVRTGTTTTASSARGWIHGPGNEGVLKLVEDVDRRVLVGGTSMGPTGGEVLSMLTLAISEQVPTSRLRQMIYAYPTFHRGLLDALAALERD